MMVSLFNPKTQQSKTVKMGFSWTTFFFGFFPALFREDWKWFIIILIIEAVFGISTFGFGFCFVGVVFSFFYNKLYIKDLLKNGWKPFSSQDDIELVNNGYINV